MDALAPAGIGLKDDYLAAVLCGGDGVDALGFVELHAENLMGAGGPRLAALDRLRQRMPLSIHGVGLSIGGPMPPNPRHLDRLAAVLDRFEPALYSEHLAWSSDAGGYFNDLLPLPYTCESLQRVCDHLDQIQDRLGRRVLLENPSSYLSCRHSTLSEAEFLQAVVRRSGCGLLLDLNNLYVSACNRNERADEALERCLSLWPHSVIEEIHLAGHDTEVLADGSLLRIDHHGAPISAAVWALYRRTVEVIGPVATLIERDQNLPPLNDLITEAQHAQSLMNALEGVPA